MSFLDPVSDAVAGSLGAVKDTILGRDEAPPTPTTPQQAQQMIDHVLGHQPGDGEIANSMRQFQLFSTAISRADELSGGAFSGGPYDPATRAQLATNNFNRPPDPYMIADQRLQDWLARDPRRTALYVRNYDPLNKQYLPFIMDANMQHHDGLLSGFKNKVTDVLGRPIGGALDLLTWPAAHVETWYGNNFVWNDIPDASLRHEMAKYTYESKLNLFDWNQTWERKARAQAQQIDAQGLKGDAAAKAFDTWTKTPDGHLKAAALLTDAVAQMIYDPLWLVPGEAFGKAVTAPIKMVTGVEELGKLGRLATSFGRGYAAEHSLAELSKLSEVTYATGKLSSPLTRGASLWLTERSPNWLAEAARNRIASLVSGPMLEAESPFDRLQVINKFDQMLRTGIVDDEAARLFGAKVLDDPVLAEAHFHFTNAAARDKKAATMFDGLLEGVTKNPEYIQEANPAVQTKLMLDHALTNAGAIIRDGQQSVYPDFIRKRYLPFVAAQKAVMGIFTLSRPGFIALNFANNLFTYMWHGMGHPVDATRVFSKSFFSEANTGLNLFGKGGQVPEEFQMLAKMAGIDPVTVERTVVGNVSHHDILGQALGKGFRLDNPNINVEEALVAARKVVAKPLKDMSPRRFRDMVAWPIVAAGRVDRMTRRAAFYHSLREQMLLGASPERLLLRLAGREVASPIEHLATGPLKQAPPEFKGGLIPDVHGSLVEAGIPVPDARRMEGHMIDAMRSYLLEGGSLHDPKGMTNAWFKGVQKAVGTDAVSHLSPYDLGLQYAASLGHSDEGAVIWLRDLQPAMERLNKEVMPFVGKEPLDILKNKIDRIADDYWKFDRIQAEMTKTRPVPRPGSGYSQAVGLTDEALRADVMDQLQHIERYLDAKLPTWAGNTAMRRRVLGAAGDFSTGRMSELYKVHADMINALADPATAATFDARKAWQGYFNFVDDAQAHLYNTLRDEIAKVDVTNLKPLDDWYANLLRTQKKHRDLVAKAIADGTPEGWVEAGNRIGALYRKNATDRAAIFGWNVNEEAENLGHVRPSAALTRQTEEYLEFVKSKLGPALANAVPTHPSAQALLADMSNEMVKRGPEVARILVGHARAKTDFMMLQYSSQYGIDHLLQGIFPYEFFPTRTAMNWGIRIARNPGAGAMLAKALLLPAQYQKQYGLPDRMAYRIPVPMPFLDDVLGALPGIGDKLGQAQFSNVYWIDPMSVLFPMSSFRNSYADEQKRSTPLGVVADWTEKNTPLSLSPFSKIVGSFTGALDRDAWTNSMFSGGPFGLPVTVWGQATASWVQTGAPPGPYMPPEEQANYVNKGYFSGNWIAQMFGLGKGRYSDFAAERALASLTASGDMTPDEAWDAMKNHTGPAWEKAVSASDSESFLSDLTGWAGFRVVGSLKGEQIRIGEKALYEVAAASGDLDTFYKQYPEFELERAASAGINDPTARAQIIDNQFYYQDVEKLVNQPYQKALDDINREMGAIRDQSNITEIDNERLKHLNDEVQAIREEQNQIRDSLDKAYPNHSKDISLNAPPQERQLQIISNEYHALVQKPDESYEDFQARQSRYLDQFPARTASDSPNDWPELFQTFLGLQAGYNLRINKAADEGDFDKLNSLRTERDKVYTQLNSLARQRLTRDDVEQYLANFSRRKTLGEIEFDQANALFDQWMSLVGSSSPLTSRQQAAVSAFFRQQPLLQKHYNAATIDIRNLNLQQLTALARRRDIQKHYNNLATNSAKIDYMQAVKDEYDTANAILGLPPVSVVDYRPAPPDISHRAAADAANDFTSQSASEQLAALLGADPMADPTTMNVASDGGLSMSDITRYVNPVVQRGY